ncbi:MAG: hypothetical protein JKY48_07935 [Flavobacteriales bacterium]|nr:hypothetical protein [Flavobacteriales bacterium]
MHIDEIIKNRKTQKVLANKVWPVSSNQKPIDQTINELLELAASAPYHRKSHKKYGKNNQLNSCLPWRCYTLDTENCRLLFNYIEKQNIKAGKVSNMLAAADGLMLMTWLPEPLTTNVKKQDKTSEPVPFEGNIKNMEHIAASSAAIQNILIGATARNLPNYWSSGGQLRNVTLRKFLGIPMKEILLGALFIFPEDSEQKGAIIKSGSLRHQGKELDSWVKRVDISLL